jgi:hypothetical protein
MASLKKVNKAFEELEKAELAFHAALGKFKKVYNPNTVGINEMQESLMDFMYELDEEIACEFAE